MTTTAPMYSDLNLSDPNEFMRVTNNSRKDLVWTGVRRQYRIKPDETGFIPFHVCVRYLGDPRSEYKKTESFITADGENGVIPERRGELVRLSVYYGIYHGRLGDLPKVAPKVTVTTMNGVAIDWPIFNADSTSYRYNTSDTTNIDVRTELDRLRSQIQQLQDREHGVQAHMLADDPDAGEAPLDGPPTL